MIEAQKLTKRFHSRAGEIIAAREVSFSVSSKTIMGLLGPNGAGKTTILSILATAQTPDSGVARVMNVDVAENKELVRKQIGVLSDQRGLYSRLTTKENLLYYGMLYGISYKVLKNRIAYLCDALNLTSIENRRTEGFSQGEKMKVAIARALIHDPAVLLLDEPTNGLDVMSVRRLRLFLRELRDQGKTIIFSSHIMSEVANVCDDIIVMNRGRVIAQGSTDELWAGAEQLEEAFFAILEADEKRMSAMGGNA
ncbi:MAG: ATP-binding cassette domain-containing protein [Burkholderiales bacterium]|jgi:sodium transport system ATP-binding protein|nr:ATP-binding cassette domain-containing protein [Burkholderiales bacterium]